MAYDRLLEIIERQKKQDLATLDDLIKAHQFGGRAKVSPFAFAKMIVRYGGCDISEEEIGKIAEKLKYEPNKLYTAYNSKILEARERDYSREVRNTWWYRLEVHSEAQARKEKEAKKPFIDNGINWEARTWDLATRLYLATAQYVVPNSEYTREGADAIIAEAKMFIEQYKESFINNSNNE